MSVSDDGWKIIAGANSGDPGVYVSVNGGGTWSKSTSSEFVQDCVISGDGSTMYAIYNSALYISTDLGASWRSLNDDILSTSLNVIATTLDGSTVAAVDNAGSNSVLYISNDFGQSWNDSASQDIYLNSGQGVAVTPDGSGVIATGSSYPSYVVTTIPAPAMGASVPVCTNLYDDNTFFYEDDDAVVALEPSSAYTQYATLGLYGVDSSEIAYQAMNYPIDCSSDYPGVVVAGNGGIQQYSEASNLSIAREDFLMYVQGYYPETDCQGNATATYCVIDQPVSQDWIDDFPPWFPSWASWEDCPPTFQGNSYGQIEDPSYPGGYIQAYYNSSNCSGPPICTGIINAGDLVPSASVANLSTGDQYYSSVESNLPTIFGNQTMLVVRYYATPSCSSIGDVYFSTMTPANSCTLVEWFNGEPSDIIMFPNCTGYTKYESSNGTCAGTSQVRYNQTYPLKRLNECYENYTSTTAVSQECVEYIAPTSLPSVAPSPFPSSPPSVAPSTVGPTSGVTTAPTIEQGDLLSVSFEAIQTIQNISYGDYVSNSVAIETAFLNTVATVLELFNGDGSPDTSGLTIISVWPLGTTDSSAFRIYLQTSGLNFNYEVRMVVGEGNNYVSPNEAYNESVERLENSVKDGEFTDTLRSSGVPALSDATADEEPTISEANQEVITPTSLVSTTLNMLSDGAIAGIAIGVIVCVLIAGFIYFRIQKRNTFVKNLKLFRADNASQSHAQSDDTLNPMQPL